MHIVELPPPLPDSWCGTLAEFFDTYVDPWWPAPDKIAAWTEAAITWHQRPDCLLLVRRGADKGWLHWEDGYRVVFTDNAPGIWILIRARDCGADAVCWPELIEGGQLPVLKMRPAALADRPWNHATAAFSGCDAKVLWSRGLKLCHIFELSDRPGRTLIQRSLRNVALMNYFVFPNGLKHFRTEREGWFDQKHTKDLGESSTVCDYALHELIVRLRSVAPDVPERFLKAIGEVMPSKPKGELRIRIERRDSSLAITPNLRGRTPNSVPSRRSRQATLRGPNTRQWTLRRDNHEHCHGLVDLSESPLSLDLSWRADSRSEAIPVGIVHLDLYALLERGYIRREDSAGSGGTKVRLRVVMASDGKFYVQTKRNEPSFLLRNLPAQI